MLRTHTLPTAGVLLVLLSTPALAARLGGSVSSSPGHPIVNAKVETRSVDAAVRVAQYRKQR